MKLQRHGASMRASSRPAREEGVVLVIALIVLVAMTLAGIGLMRSLDTGTLVASNLGFRQSAVASGDGGTEAAIAWLQANVTALNSDNATMGYYSTRQDSVDITGNRTEGGTDGVDWGGSDATQTTKARDLGNISGDSSGNQVLYVINRLCNNTGSINASNQSCATTTGSGASSSMDAPTYDSQGLLLANRVYYRITSRINGPKNTVSYVQAVILI